MPINILLVQGAVVTVMSLLYFVIQDVSVVFFLISAMTIALYLIAYMFMYAAARLTASIGFVGVAFSFLVAFFPPDQLPMGSPGLYVALVIIGTVFFCAIPLVIHGMRRTQWERLQPMLLPAE